MPTTIDESREFYRSYFSSEGDISYNNRQRYEVVFSLIDEADVDEDSHVLDVGSGSGKIAQYLDQRFENVVTLDITANPLIQEVSEGGVTFTEGALPDLPFRGEVFDLVVCSEVLEHIPDRQTQVSSVNELSRVLRDDGRIVVSTPNPDSVYKLLKDSILDMAELTPFYERSGGQIVENWIPPAQLGAIMAKNFKIEAERGSYYTLPGFGSGLESLLRPISDEMTERNIAPHHGLYQYYLGRKSEW